MEKKGFSLITVLAALVVLMLGTAAILQAVGSYANMKYNNHQEVKARFLAEAGMQYALWKCRTGSCPPSSTIPPSSWPSTGCPPVATYGGQTITINSTDDTWIAATALSNAYRIQVCTEYTNA